MILENDPGSMKAAGDWNEANGHQTTTILYYMQSKSTVFPEISFDKKIHPYTQLPN